MNITCPKNPEEHNTFIVTAHVTEDWIVDESSMFIDVLPGHQTVTHKPELGDLFECATCGTQAKVET